MGCCPQFPNRSDARTLRLRRGTAQLAAARWQLRHPGARRDEGRLIGDLTLCWVPRPRLCVGVSSTVERVRTPTQSRGCGTQTIQFGRWTPRGMWEYLAHDEGDTESLGTA